MSKTRIAICGALVCAVCGMWACDKSPGSGPSKPLVRSEKPLTADEGRALFNRACLGCHGVQGKGDGPRARTMSSIPDFTTEAFQQTRSDKKIRKTIQRGRGKMPSFAKRYGEHEHDALVKVVRSFAPTKGK